VTWLVIALFGIPIAVAVAMTAVAFRRVTPLAFQCQRCAREFRRKPWQRFPARCPACGADDWNRDA
jgi:Zn finger protein HypA/HybF involved in hydrogenase expression